MGRRKDDSLLLIVPEREDNLTREEIEGVGFQWGDYDEAMEIQSIGTKEANTLTDGEEIYYISSPAPGLWAYRDRFE